MLAEVNNSIVVVVVNISDSFGPVLDLPDFFRASNLPVNYLLHARNYLISKHFILRAIFWTFRLETKIIVDLPVQF